MVSQQHINEAKSCAPVLLHKIRCSA